MKIKELEKLRERIEENVEYVDVKPFSHNIIGMTLRIIAEEFGKEKANQAIEDFICYTLRKKRRNKMSKDFNTLHEMGICSKEQALKAYCTSQSVFYPPHPDYVVKSMVAGFKKYWKGKINLEKLTELCYLRDLEALYKYFGQFLNEEDFE